MNALTGLLRCLKCGTTLERTKDGMACPKCPKDKGGKITKSGDGVQFKVDGKDIFNT